MIQVRWKWFWIILFIISVPLASWCQKVTVSGYVRDARSLEPLVGARISINGKNVLQTNPYGFYSVSFGPSERLQLAFGLLGYQSKEVSFGLKKDTVLNVALEVEIRQLAAVTVTVRPSSADHQRPGLLLIPVDAVKSLPGLGGEKDVFKTIQLLPGVKKLTEGNNAFYVRGGGADQNLVLLDEAPVYTANHLFGFFSVFNGDAVKDIQFYRGGFPARYGGRASSVTDIRLKEGNREKYQGEVGIGLLSSRLTVEGPIKRKKSSFLLSGRRTYADLLTRPFLRRGNGTDLGYYFYDVNAKAGFEIDRRNSVYLSGYFGRDQFYLNDRIRERKMLVEDRYRLGWQNAAFTLRWNHVLSEKIFSNLTVLKSAYRFYTQNQSRTGALLNPSEKISRYGSGVNDFSVKYDLDLFPRPEHSLRAGFAWTLRTFCPGELISSGNQPNPFAPATLSTSEAALYAEDQWTPARRFSLNAGIRLSAYQVEQNRYLRPEPRLSISWQFSGQLSLKTSYSRMNQYLHQLTNTGLGLPTDLWVPAVNSSPPQSSHQVTTGIEKSGNAVKVVLEAYYKKMTNSIAYREGANFLQVDIDGAEPREVDWRKLITSGEGWSSGLEAYVEKRRGKLTGWVAYTLSWTRLHMAELNGGKPFYPRYDRRHEASFVGIFQFSKTVTFSGTWVYGSGSPIPVPHSLYTVATHEPVSGPMESLPGEASSAGLTEVSEYGSKDVYRSPPYHRLDINVQFHRKKKRLRTWEISLYNAYNRKNALFYTLENRETAGSSQVALKKVALLPIIPSVSYQLRF